MTSISWGQHLKNKKNYFYYWIRRLPVFINNILPPPPPPPREEEKKEEAGIVLSSSPSLLYLPLYFYINITVLYNAVVKFNVHFIFLHCDYV